MEYSAVSDTSVEVDRLFKAYLAAGGELHRKQAELDAIELNLTKPTLASFHAYSAVTGPAKYRPRERKGERCGGDDGEDEMLLTHVAGMTRLAALRKLTEAEKNVAKDTSHQDVRPLALFINDALDLEEKQCV